MRKLTANSFTLQKSSRSVNYLCKHSEVEVFTTQCITVSSITKAVIPYFVRKPLYPNVCREFEGKHKYYEDYLTK